MADQQKYVGRLAGARVLIVGGSAGIGYGVAEALIEHGASIIISSSRQSRIDEAIASLTKAYPSAKGRIVGYPCDLSNEETLEKNAEELLDKVGSLDHIVFTAGDQLRLKSLEHITLKDYKAGGTVRFLGAFILCKTAWVKKTLKPGPESSIVLSTGTISQKAVKDWSIHAGWMSGLHSMTRNLALEMKPIRVNIVNPGMVVTPLWDGFTEDARQNMYEAVGKAMPTGRVGQVEDVALAYIHLMLDRNCTGTIVNSDSGSLII